MKLRASAQEPDLSPSVYESDPDEKEISDDDDDDRNHKHRRRDDARSQSLDEDALEQVFTKPYRKGIKPFQNGHLYREPGSQSSETWKVYNYDSMDKNISTKFDKRRPGFTQFSRGPSDLNQRIRVNPTFSGDPGPGRARGRDSGHWSQRDPRFNSVDIASQIVQQGSIPHNMFAGRGLGTVSNAHGPSWSAFGFPGIPNGGLDTFHPLGLQGTFGPAITTSLNMGLARQRCRDFEEQGFCLRGDMCPMEHGVNRIVVEDVQSLSQFNLPVSLPSSNLHVSPVEPGSLPAISAPTNTLLNSKGLHGKIIDNGLGDNGTSIDSDAADFYDPDQPLWGNDSQTSTAPQSMSQSNVEKNEPLLHPDPSGDNVDLCNGSDNERVVSSAGIAVGSQSTSLSVWGRIGSTKNKPEMRENMIYKASPSNFIHNETLKTQDPTDGPQGVPRHGKWNNLDSSLKMSSGSGHIVRKPSQKAQRTLFVNGIPQQNNRRESLLSHFQKFGEVIDVYIPSNSERAFVQFSKKEEAEAALMAPDAVMGNRFIKLWWANRDNIPDSGIISGHNMPIPPRGVAIPSASPYISVANKGKDDHQLTSQNGITAPAHVPASDHPKPVVANGPKVPPPLQKKLESLEVLKEELRKKQELLDQKRNDFRRKLDKLERQATGLKGEAVAEQVAKKQKLEIAVDSIKAATSSSSDPDTIVPSPRLEMAANSSKSVERAKPENSKTAVTVVLQEPSSLKPSLFPLARVGPSVVPNRFKLDNRPTAFKILPPLPNDLSNVPILKEHFLPYGDLSKVQLDDMEPIDGNGDPKTSKASARIYFTTRHAAEKAFLNGKCWKGHNMQFTWLKPSNPSKDSVNEESPRNLDASSRPATSGSGDSEQVEKTDIDEEHVERDEVHNASGIASVTSEF